MTPATPPNSRNKRNSGKSESLLATPERTAEANDSGLVTPGTIRVKDRLQAPTRPTNLTSPCHALKTPEYTPHKGRHTKRRLDFDQEKLRPISRVLFESELPEASQTNRSLLPPKRTGAIDISNESQEDEYTQLQETVQGLIAPSSSSRKNKVAKQVPGTPSDKITTFELASKWHNESGLNCADEEDLGIGQDPIISKQEQTDNPFLSSYVADENVRTQRRQKLLQENPDIEDAITYVDKAGNVTQRHLTEEQKRIKPTRLFADQLDRKV